MRRTLRELAAAPMTTTLLLLLLASSIAWPSLAQPLRFRNPWAVPPWVVNDPEVKRCLSSLRCVGGCVSSVFASFSTGRIQLGPDCCSAVGAMGSHCFTTVFTSFYFDNSFASRVEEFCRLPSAAAAPVQAENTPSCCLKKCA